MDFLLPIRGTYNLGEFFEPLHLRVSKIYTYTLDRRKWQLDGLESKLPFILVNTLKGAIGLGHELVLLVCLHYLRKAPSLRLFRKPLNVIKPAIHLIELVL
jgi:hypothetical protein